MGLSGPGISAVARMLMHAHGAHTWRTHWRTREHTRVHVGRAARYDTRITGCSTVGHITTGTAHTPWLCLFSVLCRVGLSDPRGRERKEEREAHGRAPLVDLHGQVRGRARPGNLGSAQGAEAGGWEIQRRPETPLRAMPDTALRSPAGGMLGLPYGVAGWSLLTKLRFSQRTEPYDRGGSDVSGHISGPLPNL